MILRIILGIIALVIIFFPLAYFIYLKHKTVIALQKVAMMNPKLKEKVKIIRSREEFSAVKSKEKTKKNFIFVVLFLVILFITITLLFKLKVNGNIIMYLLLLTLVIFLAYIKLRDKKEKDDCIKHIENLLLKKYGMIKKMPVHSKEIVYGNKSQEGNIRNNYVFSYKILKFKCLLENYYQEVLTSHLSNDSSMRHYYYKKFKNVFEYYYNLKALGVKNIDKNIIENDKIKQSIEELSKIKIINVSIENDYLLVQKEVVLFNYCESDADIDTSDVELFYNEIVKIILEVNNNAS